MIARIFLHQICAGLWRERRNKKFQFHLNIDTILEWRSWHHDKWYEDGTKKKTPGKRGGGDAQKVKKSRRFFPFLNTAVDDETATNHWLVC